MIEVIGQGGISTKIIEHSIADTGEVLITLQTRAPKFLDAEFEKHRALSSNSSSDRAIPLETMLKRDYYIPHDVRWNESGMQGKDKVTGLQLEQFHDVVRKLHDLAADSLLEHKHIHKQHLNRYLLPFSYQDKVVTGTLEQFEYFMSLRLHEAADPAIYELAYTMNEAIKQSVATSREYNTYHLPYVTEDERRTLALDTLIKCSVARCARVSYLNHDQSEPDMYKDLALHNKLWEYKHLTPFEHIATPMRFAEERHIPEGLTWEGDGDVGITHLSRDGRLWSGNFHGWIQYRKLLETRF